MFFPSTIHDEALTDQECGQLLTALPSEECDPQFDEFALGLAFFESKDFEQAARYLRRVPPNPPARFAWAQEWLGQAYLKLHREELAIEALERALQLHEYLKRDSLTVAECQFSLGLAFARSGHFEKALASFRQALRRAPEWSTIHFEEARIHAHRNRTIECLCSLSRAVQEEHFFLDKAYRDPDFAQVRETPQFQRLWQAEA